MTMLEVERVGVAYVAHKPVLKEVSFTLGAGFYGLVGVNGAGKTTLLRVLARDLIPHEGSVRLRPADGTVVLCPQTVDEPAGDIFDLAGRHDGAATELKGRLGLEEDELARWPTLSPGERKRWQIAAALTHDPDVLLLDEPTNHIDASARARLLDALRRFRGIAVVVSHDRALLERLPRAILRVHDAAVTMYAGRWSEAKAQWEASRREREEAHAAAKATLRAVERRLDAARRTQASTTSSLSARSRMKNKNDHDARSMGRKVVAGWADARAGRAVEVLRNELTRAEARVPRVERDVTLGGKIFATYERAPQRVLFHLDAPELRAGDHVVLRDVRLDIGREERVRIAGANGAGKTTLLHAIMRSKPRDDRLLFVPQELDAETTRRLTGDLRAAPDHERGRVLSIFSALGSDPERILARRQQDLAALSPGEARKLALAMGLGRHAWALVLDEPTNHLDLPTIERLESALVGYPGCVVLVTHDDELAAAVTSRTLLVEAGRVS